MMSDEKIVFLCLNQLKEGITIEEKGKTFLENAIIKAKTVSKKFKFPAIGDDSGLIVPVLNNEPGIYSARYAHENANDLENNLKLMRRIKTSLFKRNRSSLQNRDGFLRSH